jgi:hypothetical protein
LFDLLSDPREEHDLAKDPSQLPTLKCWRDRLVKLLADRPEGFSDGNRLIPGRPYPLLQPKAARMLPEDDRKSGEKRGEHGRPLS